MGNETIFGSLGWSASDAAGNSLGHIKEGDPVDIVLDAAPGKVFKFGGGPHAGEFTSGFITFLVLLGTSTMVDKDASSNFYLRIFLILFAGIFAVAGLVLVEYLLRSKKSEKSLSLQVK